MRTEFRRDMDHNYLILQEDITVDTSAYQVRMLAGNVIPSILKCRIQSLDGSQFFSYDITSKQPLSVLYEEKKFRIKDLQMVLGGFVNVMEELTEFLMNPEQLILRPEYIYLDIESQKVYFCCLPGFYREIQQQFRELTEYILPKLDHEDERAVVLGYGIYKKALEPGFQLETVKAAVYRKEEIKKEKSDFRIKEKPENKAELENEEQEAVQWQEISEQNEKEEKKNIFKNRKIKSAAVCAAGLLLLLAVLAASTLGYIPWLSVETAIAAGMLMLGLGALSVWIFEKKKRKQENEEIWKKKSNKTLPEREMALHEAKRSEDLSEKWGQGEDHVETELGETGALFDKTLGEDRVLGETVVLSTGQQQGPASFVSREPGELATIYLDRDLIVVGKLVNAADAVIPVPTVSRVHARIRKKDDGYYLTDLNSRNGTAVNGIMLKGNEEYLLQDEDEVDFAQARYVFLK